MSEAPPVLERIPVPAPAAAMTVDVEEWYHNCWVPEYVDPALRPPLVEELDRTLPALLAELEAAGARATLFVLGEVAARIPGRIREAAAAGHEIACHGYLHRRANDLSPAAFRTDVRRAKEQLEQLVGAPVLGFRAPEWSLRTIDNPRLRIVAELGFKYDSSLNPSIGAGSAANPLHVVRLRLPGNLQLVEVPPLTWGGALRLPVGSWCGRWAAPSWIEDAIESAADAGRLPVFVVHPWELAERELPGLLTGFARFFHEAGRADFRERFRNLLRARSWRTVREALGARLAERAAEPSTDEVESFEKTRSGFAVHAWTPA